ncbi:hypothetical protein [Spirosoma agri]|uniref:Uncharacterized protein n=1 Tax=Spirosoma agri TaxID=1987381 RepID=A0A6M0INV8_9BACT|nr:hypothetical protein [Spirosoma agri]NEU69744.1 hypothetical protein [Spirosoma agri]
MKTHEELVDEVYRNASFRSEFICYVKLSNALKTEIEVWTQARYQEPAPWTKRAPTFLRYDDLIGNLTYDKVGNLSVFADSPQIAKFKQNICFLYSSLARGLAVRYELDRNQVVNVIRDVAIRHA